MSIRNIVKVMNFHALIRVDNAKRKADKYRMMEEQLYRMMDVIMNNRNLILDKKVMEPNPNAPEIQIYIGSDFGFCSNYNSQMNERLNRAGADAEKILIGRKLISHEDHCRGSGEKSAGDPSVFRDTDTGEKLFEDQHHL